MPALFLFEYPQGRTQGEVVPLHSQQRRGCAAEEGIRPTPGKEEQAPSLRETQHRRN